MAVQHVLNLMGEHAGHLVGRSGLLEQAREHHHLTAGQRQRIDPRIIDHVDGEWVAGVVGLRRESRNDPLHGFVSGSVFDAPLAR